MNPQQLELESDRALYCYQMLFTFAFTLDFICTLASPNPLCGRNVLKLKVVFYYRKVLEFDDGREKKNICRKERATHILSSIIKNTYK